MLTQTELLSLLDHPSGKADLVIDTDTYNEIDDQFAVSLALKSPEKLAVKALYAAPFFNANSESPADGMEKSYQEIRRLLSFMGKTSVILRGSAMYLPDEKTPVDSEAARDLSTRAMAYSKEHPLYVACIGAITNVASAILMNPEISDRIVVVFLGGNALSWPDNQEFNIMQDVAAARVVFASGAPLVMLPCMGVVSSFTVSGPELEYWIKGKNPLCDYLVSHTEEAAEAYAKGKVWSRVIWDVASIGWLLNDDGSYMKDRLMPRPIPEYDHHWGFSSENALCRYVYSINRDALLERLFSALVKEI